MTTKIIKDKIFNEDGSVQARIVITIPDLSRINQQGDSSLIAIPSSRYPDREYAVAVDRWGYAYSCSCRIGRQSKPCGHLAQAELVWSCANTDHSSAA